MDRGTKYSIIKAVLLDGSAITEASAFWVGMGRVAHVHLNIGDTNRTVEDIQYSRGPG